MTNAAALVRELDRTFGARSLADWLPSLQNLEVPWTVAQTALEALHDPQAAANGYVVPVDARGETTIPLVTSPVQFDGQRAELRPAPEHGQNTEEVLLELGRSWDDIAALKAAEVIAVTERGPRDRTSGIHRSFSRWTVRHGILTAEALAMQEPVDQAAALVDELAVHTSDRVGASGSREIEFVRRYWSRTAADDLVEREPSDLVGAALVHLHLARRRPPERDRSCASTRRRSKTTVGTARTPSSTA